jgi:hypothetical protein
MRRGMREEARYEGRGVLDDALHQCSSSMLE